MSVPLSPIRACVFDAYGTLLDIASPVADEADALGSRAGELSALGIRLTAVEGALTLLQGSLQGLSDDLGARIARLIERHRSTRRAVDELRAALVERDRRVIELDAKLAAFERVRAELLQRIDALVAQVDRLAEAGAESAS